LGFVAQPFSLALSPPSIPKQERKSNQFIQSIVTAKQENTILHQYSSLPRERNHTGCLLPTERATPVPKKKIRQTQKKMEMQVYLLLIFTCMTISVPNEQKSTTLVHYLRK
jgi:hypothetical protein